MAYIIEDFMSQTHANEIRDACRQQEFKHSGFHPQTKELQWENVNLPVSVMLRLEIYFRNYGRTFPFSDNFKDHSVDSGHFQRCYIPFGVHHDSKKRHNPDRPDAECNTPGFAILIPMDEGPNLNTIFWKEKFYNNNDMTKMFFDFGSLDAKDVKNSGIGDKYDLAFADDNPDRKIYNHLTVDCIFNWKFGDAAVFDRTQLHAATDFTKHHQYKDAITVFFN